MQKDEGDLYEQVVYCTDVVKSANTYADANERRENKDNMSPRDKAEI